MSNNSRKHELSFEEAIQHLIGSIQAQVMGENTLVSGQSERYLRLRLCVSFIADRYDLLAVDLFVQDVHSTGYRLRINLPEFAPPKTEWNNPSLEVGHGGYYWAADRRFYNWVPNNGRIVERVRRIMVFHRVNE